jgi:acyl-CoA synthetase (AMP-forming)/AMP-acid ligase II
VKLTIPQDSVTVENALYADPRISEAAAVGVPDKRLGELVAAVVAVKPGFEDRVTEASLISLVRKRLVSQMHVRWLNADPHDSLPRFAVPVMIIVQNHPFSASITQLRCRRILSNPHQAHTPSEKIIKGDLRKLARRQWELRQRYVSGLEPFANL